MSTSRFALFEDYLDKLPNLHGADELASATSAVSGAFGLPMVMTGALLMRGDKIDARFYFGNWPVDWCRLTLEQGLVDDPVIQEARRRLAPFTLSDLLAEDDFPAASRTRLEQTQQQRWAELFAVPIHGPGGYVGLVSFAGPGRTLGASDRAVLLALAHHSHQRGRALCGEIGPCDCQLTRRELQTMRWVSRGKTDAEIAEILNLSTATVHYYVERAKHKLGVRSRSQAIGELALRELLLRADM